MDWLRREVHAEGGVDARDPGEAAPAEVEASSVEHDVNGSHVPRLSPEELGEVDELKDRRHPGAVDKPV